MKKIMMLLVAITIIGVSDRINAYENNIKFGVGLPRAINLEYERYLNNVFPNLSAYVNYGTGEFKFDDVDTKLNGFGLGARYKIPFVGKFSFGFLTLNLDYKYQELGQTVDVSGQMSGLIIEYIREFKFGPISVGGSLSYLMGKPNVTAKKGETELNSDDIDGLATAEGLPEFRLHVGYAF